ncbi:hypothetical protein BDA99DRAFT_499949 [Phascolomyces articulosus]|uniref:Anti-proliferative protein domain-containing protein n=1 Tax=Phascolomyces articulosus TaxID=60185 RepID=A0AAD5KJ81_9FUNG|nr:hypothetical protein BDA99DRAFT_499949 [Phascolomyces articulosus]
MHMEIAQAVDFLGRLLQSKFEQNDLLSFKHELTKVLKARFADHWDPQQPTRGNGFRSISNLNSQLDPVLLQAAVKSSVSPSLIYMNLPRDFVLWIDPFSVSYRVGDHGNIMTLFEDRSRGRITFKLDPNSMPKSPAMSPHIIPPPRASSAVRISPPPSPHQLQRHATPPPLAASPLSKHVKIAKPQPTNTTLTPVQSQQEQVANKNKEKDTSSSTPTSTTGTTTPTTPDNKDQPLIMAN